MLWKDILRILDSRPIVVLQQKNDPNLLFAEHLSGPGDELNADCLYFAALSTLSRTLPASRPPEPSSLSLVLFCDAAPPDRVKALFDNIICIYDLNVFLEVFQFLQKSLRRSLHLSARLQEFVELVAIEDDLNTLVQWISDFYGYPVHIFDNSFTYIAHSKLSGFAQFGTDILVKELEQGYISDLSHIQRLQKEQNLTIFDGLSQPMLLRHEGGQFNFYHAPVRIGTTTAGALGIYLPPDKTLDALELLYLEKMIRLLGIVLQRTDFYTTNKAGFYTSFFTAMLSAQPDHSKKWESRLAAYGYPLQPNMYMAVVDFPDAIQKRSELNNLADSLHRIFPGSIYYIHDSLILLFCSTKEDTFSVPSLINQKDNFFAANVLKVGVSSVFHSVYDMSLYYEEAYTALRLGSTFAPDNCFYFYDDLRIYDMVCRLARDNDVTSFCYPPFMELFRYDQRHNSQLGPTLFFHLLSPKDPEAVCRRLSIHKNTLYFRLQKIRSIMKVDYTNLAIAAQIFITIIILRYNRRINENTADLSHFFSDTFFPSQAIQPSQEKPEEV